MLKFKLAHIGKNEIERAIKVLEENKDIKKIFVRISHNDEVRGAEYDDMLELLSDEDSVYFFANKNECMIDYEWTEPKNMLMQENFPELFENGFLELFKNGGVYCDFENKRFSNEVEDIVKPIIECGDYCNYYSREEAIENLNGSNVDESLVGYILKENK